MNRSPEARQMFAAAMAVALVGEHLRDGLSRYVFDKLPPGGYMQHVLANDLREAIMRENPHGSTRALVTFLDIGVPRECWGSPAALAEWVGPERASRLEVAEARAHFEPVEQHEAAEPRECDACGFERPKVIHELSVQGETEPRVICEICYVTESGITVNHPDMESASVLRMIAHTTNLVLESIERNARPNEAAPTDRISQEEGNQHAN